MRCYCGEIVNNLDALAKHILADTIKHGGRTGDIAWARAYVERKHSVTRREKPATMQDKETFYKDMLERERKNKVSPSL